MGLGLGLWCGLSRIVDCLGLGAWVMVWAWAHGEWSGRRVRRKVNGLGLGLGLWSGRRLIVIVWA